MLEFRTRLSLVVAQRSMYKSTKRTQYCPHSIAQRQMTPDYTTLHCSFVYYICVHLLNT